jgi:hypothetical protein
MMTAGSRKTHRLSDVAWHRCGAGKYVVVWEKVRQGLEARDRLCNTAVLSAKDTAQYLPYKVASPLYTRRG